MGNNYSSIGEVLAYFMKLNKYATDVLLKLNQTVITNDDVVTIQLQNSSGEFYDYKIPSFNNMDKRIKEIDRQLRKIYLVRDKDNYVNIFGNELVHEPDLITGITIPTEFYSKPNYFFENMLNPLMYIKVSISDHVTANSKFIQSRRVILEIDNDEKQHFFDINFNKKNNLIYKNVIESLETEGIDFTFDDEILNLPPVILQYSGSFTVQENLGTLPNTTYNLVKRYKLNTLEYTENLSDGTTTPKKLKGGNNGDTLITTNGETHFKVVSVDQENNIVDLGLMDGYDEVQITTDALRIASPLAGEKYFHITIGSKECQIVFLKSIDAYDHITTQSWSNGIAFNSSELTIKTNAGIIPLETYYNQQVNDYAKLFYGIIKEQNLPIFDVIKPDPPALKEENFKITQLNKQTVNADNVKKRQDIVERRDLLETKKTVLDIQITTDTKSYEEDITLTEAERTALKTSIDDNIVKKIDVVAEITALKQDIQVEVDKIKTEKTPEAKFVIEGAWDLPIPKDSATTGPQYPTHFKIKITYLDSNGVQNPSPLINVTKEDGNVEPCYVPVFNLLQTHIRNLIIDSAGKLVPEDIDLSDPSFRPINQLPTGIPINVISGEKVQIQIQTCIKTINNEVCSDWSSPIVVSVPPDIIPQIMALQSIDNKLKYYYEMDTRNDDVNQLLKQFSFLTQKVNNIASLKRFDERATVTYVLTEADIHNSKIYLPDILPFDVTGPDSISIYAIGGLRGQRGIDYQIINNDTLTWEGLQYAAKFAPGDQIVITYMDYNL